jgi:hypothetical protein
MMIMYRKNLAHKLNRRGETMEFREAAIDILGDRGIERDLAESYIDHYFGREGEIEEYGRRAEERGQYEFGDYINEMATEIINS